MNDLDMLGNDKNMQGEGQVTEGAHADGHVRAVGGGWADGPARDAANSQLDMDSALAEVAELCERRAQTYALLSRVFNREVDDALMAELKGMRFPAHSANPSMQRGYASIVKYLSQAWENSEFDLAVDYVRAFIGHGINGHSAAYPYESAYRSKKHLLMQGVRDEVLALYRAAGIDKAKGWTEGEDHVAAELEFMQLLSARAARCARAGDEASAAAALRTQANFMDDHLLKWVPVFAGEVETFAQTDFYRGFASLTAGYLEEDSSLLAEMVSLSNLQDDEG